MIDIIEETDQMSVSDEVGKALTKAGLITPNNQSEYYRLTQNATWHQVDVFIFNTVVANLPINR